MRIGNLRLDRRGGNALATATVEWEDCARPPLDLWFETPEEFASDLRAEPNAFLLACVIPAVYHGESRIALAGPVSGPLLDGLATATGLLRRWYGESRRPVRIESSSGQESALPPDPPRSAFFLSGGVDSLHLLYRNRECFPPDHPASFRDGLFVYGRDFPGSEDSPASRDHLERSVENLRPIAAETNLQIVRIGTNARRLESGDGFFLLEYFASFLVAAAHAFARRWSSVSLASSWDLGHLRPWGSHPLLDPCFGTTSMDVRHEGAGLTRMEKLLELARRDAAIGRLVVCNHAPPAPYLNCGKCGKCLLTLASLLLAGRIDAASSFPPGSLAPGAIRELSVDGDFADLWRQRMGPLEAAGHRDLAEAVAEKVREGENHRRWAEKRGWKGRARRIDERFFGGRVRRIARGR